MMRAIAAFLLLLAGGAEGRLPLFGQTGGDGNNDDPNDDGSRPGKGSPSIGPGRDGTTSRALTYTSDGLWSRCSKPCDKWERSQPDEGTLIREAYAGSASEICPPRHPMVWVLTDYEGGQWTKLDQYLMPLDLTCKGYCPLEPKKGRKPRNSGIPGNCYSADNPGN
jgi:hypothetical protein